MTDCLVVGFNDSNFDEYVNLVSSMGKDSGAYRDLNLAFINYNGRPRRSMDMLNHFYYENHKGPYKPFHNADFLWPVITYLGTYLLKKGFSFDYVNLPHQEEDKFKEKLLHDDILTIAITTTLYVTPHPIIEIISFIKRYNNTAKIVVGGPFISNQPKLADMISLTRLFKYLGADIYVISQEGEAALVNLISALKSNASLGNVDNIAYKSGDKYIMTGTSVESNPLEENMVDYTLFPKQEIAEFVTLRTAKSCPFSCAFCGFPQRAGKYKYLSVELVEKELNAIRDIGGVTTLTFIDDTFNVPKERFRELLRMMIRNNYGFKWNSFYRCDHGDEQTIELMGKAGCEGVFLGVESGSDEMLKRMNKTARRKNYLEAIPLLREAGISIHANLIIGFPGETYATAQESIDLIEQTRPDFYRAQLWYADPITPIWDRRDEYGVKGSAFTWSHNTMDSQTACELIDKMFVSIKGSVWLPQNGFEQWSTFYLQRKGMSMEQIKTFLKCFNAIIKEKLIYPNKEEADPQLLENLRSSCHFGRDSGAHTRPVEIFPPYEAAEQFWLAEFDQELPCSSIEAVRENAETDGDGYASLVTSVERSSLENAAVTCDADLSSLLLAAYSVLLCRLCGAQDTIVVACGSSNGEDYLIPLWVKVPWGMSFADLTQAIKKKTALAAEHQTYAFYLLTSPALMAEHDRVCPVFDVGYAHHRAEDGRPITCLKDRLSLFRGLGDAMGLFLETKTAGDSVILEFMSRRSWLTEQVVERLASHLSAILIKAAGNTSITVQDLLIEGGQEKTSPALETHVNETFSF
jgi:radical SAM PhpK family P-methyltransferase